MKTLVLGLFDEIEDARRVLQHLASSPLDLSTIQVIHGDPSLQRELAGEVGLPSSHSLAVGLTAGAVLGGAVGALVPTLMPAFDSLGSLLTAAAGILIGGLLGAAMGALTGSIRVPPSQQAALVEAIEGGATAIVVQTDKLPTARAIGDLFRMSGSRILAGAPEEPWPERGQGAVEGRPMPSAPALAAEDHSRFAPPWRRPRATETPGPPAVDPD